jgi:Ca-activated chloride channel homolog
MTSPLKRLLGGSFAALAGLLATSAAHAVVAVSWTAPSSSALYAVGQVVNPLGNANASGTVGGTGLDLALVLDSSGSMATVESGQSRRVWLQQASTALVNALPAASTSVTVVDFDSAALVRQSLTPLSGNTAGVIAAINAVNASGGTNIGAGIERARAELIGPAHTDGRVQMMVVVSDGTSSGTPANNAAAALAAGVDAIHTVGIPGHNVATMRAIATAGNGIYTDGSNLTGLINLFNGTSGNLVGIAHVDVTMNDGSFIAGIAIDGLGNFSLPNAVLQAGANVFTAVAFDTLGNSATAVLTLQAVPEPSTYALFGLGLAMAGLLRRRT